MLRPVRSLTLREFISYWLPCFSELDFVPSSVVCLVWSISINTVLRFVNTLCAEDRLCRDCEREKERKLTAARSVDQSTRNADRTLSLIAPAAAD